MVSRVASLAWPSPTDLILAICSGAVRHRLTNAHCFELLEERPEFQGGKGGYWICIDEPSPTTVEASSDSPEDPQGCAFAQLISTPGHSPPHVITTPLEPPQYSLAQQQVEMLHSWYPGGSSTSSLSSLPDSFELPVPPCTDLSTQFDDLLASLPGLDEAPLDWDLSTMNWFDFEGWAS